MLAIMVSSHHEQTSFQPPSIKILPCNLVMNSLVAKQNFGLLLKPNMSPPCQCIQGDNYHYFFIMLILTLEATSFSHFHLLWLIVLKTPACNFYLFPSYAPPPFQHLVVIPTNPLQQP